MRAMVLIVLLGVAGCVSSDEVRRSEPIWSGHYEAAFEPFSQCLWQAIQGRFTAGLVYDDPKNRAHLDVYVSGGDLSVYYEIVVERRNESEVEVEMRINVSFTTQREIADVRATSERCARQT